MELWILGMLMLIPIVMILYNKREYIKCVINDETKINIGIVINKSAKEITDAFFLAENMKKWMSGLIKVQIISGKRREIGSKMLCYYKTGNEEEYMLSEVLEEYKENKYIKSSVRGYGMEVEVIIELSGNGDVTKVDFFWRCMKTKHFLMRLMVPFNRNRIIKGAEKDLITFKNLIESKGSDFSI